MAFAEHVAPLGQSRSDGFRDHPVDDEIDVRVGSLAILVRDLVSPEQRRRDLERRLGGDPAKDAQLFELVFDRETVATLGFDCRRAVCQEQRRVSPRDVEERILGGRASLTDGAANAAARASDLLVRPTRGTHLVLGSSRAGENGMRVCVDESGSHGTAARVDATRVGFGPRCDLAGRADVLDDAVADKNGAVCNDSELAELVADTPAIRTGEGEQFGGVLDEKGRAHDVASTSRPTATFDVALIGG